MRDSDDIVPETEVPPDPEVTVDALSPRLRSRVIALASSGLGKVPPTHVPAVLRRSAEFAPAKRARLVGTQIAAVLDSDQNFREHLAAQVRALTPDVVRMLESGAAADLGGVALMEAAAVAFVVRSDGWHDVVLSATTAEHAAAALAPDIGATVDKLAVDLAMARRDAKATRDKLRAQIDTLKSDNTTLRRTLGQTRAQLRQVETATAVAAEELEEARSQGAVATRVAEAEVRRLRARIDQLESQTTSIRRAARDDRDAETMRLRLLIDTVMDGAAGLRRELALPPSELLPADTVRAIVPDVDGGFASAGSLPGDDPALLRRLLELPQVHLLVDGYNVSKSAWPTAALGDQRSRLSSRVAALVGGKAVEVTIVFDGADLGRPPSVTAPRGVRVLFSPPGVIADDTIRQLVSAEPIGRPLIVVSTDRELAESVSKMGARSITSQTLIAALGL